MPHLGQMRCRPPGLRDNPLSCMAFCAAAAPRQAADGPGCLPAPMPEREAMCPSGRSAAGTPIWCQGPEPVCAGGEIPPPRAWKGTKDCCKGDRPSVPSQGSCLLGWACPSPDSWVLRLQQAKPGPPFSICPWAFLWLGAKWGVRPAPAGDQDRGAQGTLHSAPGGPRGPAPPPPSQCCLFGCLMAVGRGWLSTAGCLLPCPGSLCEAWLPANTAGEAQQQSPRAASLLPTINRGWCRRGHPTARDRVVGSSSGVVSVPGSSLQDGAVLSTPARASVPS